MANLIIPYTTSGDYTVSDTNKYEVSGGYYQSKENLTNVEGRWQMNESSGSNVPDDSGNSRNGTLQGATLPTWVSGKLNNALSFGAVNDQYIGGFGNIYNFDYDNPFSIAMWVKPAAAGRTRYLMGKSDGTDGWALFIQADGDLEMWMRATGTTRQIQRVVDTNVEDDAWHFIVITYDGSRTVAGLKLYVDNAQPSTITTTDTIIGGDSMIVSTDFNIASINNGSSTYRDGLIDITMITDIELTTTQINYLWNAGAGRESFVWHTDNTVFVYKTLGDDINVNTWDGFSETMGPGNAGSARYRNAVGNISNVEYWNGSAWAAAGITDYNTAATVNTNIPTFDGVGEVTYFLAAHAIHTELQKFELDLNTINFTENQSPLVNAGTNKTAFDNETKKPFSDCSFSDPDGTITNAFYRIPLLGITETEILIGGYASLLEAAQNLEIVFDELGDIECYLKVRDNVGSEAEDSMTMTVSKYTHTFEAKDLLLNDLINLTFLPGNGDAAITVDSPFTYEYRFLAAPITAVIDKAGYQQENVVITQASLSHSVTMRPTILPVLENMHIDQFIYDPADKPLTRRVRYYDPEKPASVGTDNDVIETFNVTSIYNGLGRLVDYKAKRVLP